MTNPDPEIPQKICEAFEEYGGARAELSVACVVKADTTLAVKRLGHARVALDSAIAEELRRRDDAARHWKANWNAACHDIAAKDAEIERLKAALKEISCGSCDAEVCDCKVATARSALSPDSPREKCDYPRCKWDKGHIGAHSI